LAPDDEGDCIALAGKIAVCAIGGGTIEPGETDCGIEVIALGSAGVAPPPPCEEHPAANSAKRTGKKMRRERVVMDGSWGW
jgi:hypothetical protein